MNTQPIWKLRDEIIDQRTELLESADGRYFDDAELLTRSQDLKQQIDLLGNFAEAIEAGANMEVTAALNKRLEEIQAALMEPVSASVANVLAEEAAEIHNYLQRDGDPRTPAQICDDERDRDYQATIMDARM